MRPSAPKKQVFTALLLLWVAMTASTCRGDQQQKGVWRGVHT